MNNKESNEIIDEGEEMDINEPSDELFEKISLNNDSLNEDFVKLNIYLILMQDLKRKYKKIILIIYLLR